MKLNLNILNPAPALRRLKTKPKTAILTAWLATGAAIIASLPAVTHFIQCIIANGLMRETIDKMVADSAYSLLIFLPAVILLALAYLLLERHSLGWKVSAAAAAASASLAVFLNLSLEYKLVFFSVAVLTGAAAFIDLKNRRSSTVKLKDSAAVTENVVKIWLKMSGLICVLILVGMLVYLAIRATAYLSVDFLTNPNWGFSWAAQVIQGKAHGSLGGVRDFAVGSLTLASACEAIAVPLGLGAAIYLSEYAPKSKFTSVIRYFIETLAGIPSVVIGLVGAAIFVTAFAWGYSLLGAAISLAFMILPFNIRIAEEAMRSVPQSYREAAFALGATKWQTVTKAVLFSAMPGIITGILLGFGEALGETIVIALTVGWAPPENLNSSGQIIANFTIMPPLNRIFATHQIFPALSTFIWQAPTLLKYGAAAEGLYFKQTGLVLTAAFFLVLIYLAICFTALAARNYLTKKIRGK